MVIVVVLLEVLCGIVGLQTNQIHPNVLEKDRVPVSELFHAVIHRRGIPYSLELFRRPSTPCFKYAQATAGPLTL